MGKYGSLTITQQNAFTDWVCSLLKKGSIDDWVDIPAEMTHRWHWRSILPERHGQPCKVYARGKMNSIGVEFADGFRTITSRFAVRKIK